MSNHTLCKAKAQAGFTLVELAIVMIIIGLLIAGVLKGQALIANAKVTSTVAQIKSIDAAVSTFKDTYNDIPGDMVTPGARLPNCTQMCANVGNGDQALANAPGATPIGGEGEAFFPQLAVANLMTGIQPGASSAVIGQNFPAAKIGTNGIQPGSTTTSPLTLAGAVGSLGTNGGLFLAITPAIGALTNASTGMLPNEAFRIDTKMDDGSPGTGDVVGIGTAGVAQGNCGAAGQGGQYATGFTSQSCGLYIHIQG